ncbi:MAG TPA: hypothetical protein VGE69_01440 [Pseudomonadales bacterium]
MQERRSAPDSTELSPELVQKGKTRLEAEIRLIESWMAQLEGTRPDNTEMLAARKNYMDMLQSRRDLLQSLQRHRPA